MTWILQSRIRLVLAVVMATAIGWAEPQAGGKAPRQESRSQRSVTGPSEPINRAIAAGATATITLQPVPPKTFPPSIYPAGTTITGQAITLGSVPARVWIEVHVTGWGTEFLRTVHVVIDATDIDGDGGGYDGDMSYCNGSPAIGAGDITPAMQACGGTCSTDGRICFSSADCRLCIGGANAGTVCTSDSNCPDGICPPAAGITCNGVHDACRANLSGYPAGGVACNRGEPDRCLQWNGVNPGAYFPPGLWCQPGFQDLCDPEFILNDEGLEGFGAVDLSVRNYRFGIVTDVNEFTPDYAPSILGTLVLDVPGDAKGSYQIDINQNLSYLCEFLGSCNPPGDIPIAAYNVAVIKVVSCSTGADCDDGDVCTVDACVDSCDCTHSPVAGWNPATECCHPMSGVRSPIPPSSPCRIGGCSEGGSSGSPMIANVPDGTSCIPQDQCDLPGECASGVCDAEEYAGSNCPKSRFISFDVNPLNEPMAYRVRLVSLHHPDPPYSAGLTSDFSGYEGEYRWVGDATTYVESSTNLAPVYAALLECDPFYRDWSAMDLLHVTGSAVVPSSVYEVQSIVEGLDIQEESNYSTPITIVTGRWGDVFYPYNPPSTTVQPDTSDITALADKFRSIQNSVSKPRALLTGSGMTDIPDLTLDVDFAEISACLDAYRGRPYPYGGPTPCP